MAPLSSAQRQAYSSAVAALSTHAVPLFSTLDDDTSSSVPAATQWVNAFASLLLQELCNMQLEHATHGARVSAAAAAAASASASGAARQSAAFAMLSLSSRSSVNKDASDAWSSAQRAIIKALKSEGAAFAASASA